MIKYLYLLLFVGLGSLTASAQYFPSQIWHEGELTLLDGEKLRGKVKYNLEADVVQLNTTNTVQTYSARKILFFEFYDQEYGRYRQFYALPYEGTSNYRVPRLFEVLHENTLTLLCREEIVQDNVPQFGYYNYYGNRMGTRQRLDFNYFFLDRKGEIVRYSQKKDDLYDIMDNHQREVRKYMKQNRLKHDRQGDLVRITAYYNTLLNS
jgi:hypothetical protein